MVFNIYTVHVYILKYNVSTFHELTHILQQQGYKKHGDAMALERVILRTQGPISHLTTDQVQGLAVLMNVSDL